MSFGIAELAIIGICCFIPLIVIIGSGLFLTLVKLGVIGSYWLKGDRLAEEGGDYRLDQSREVS